MQKAICFIVLSFIFCTNLFCAEEGLDLILMVDTSSSMERYFGDLTNFIVSGILADYLREGDTFHLLRFADTPAFELAEKYEGSASLEVVLSKLLLLRDKLLFGKYTDIISGIEYLVRYAESLPKDKRKLLILLTDGVNDPPPESRFFGMSQDEVHNRLKELAQKTIERYGWTVRIIIYPFAESRTTDKTKATEGTKTGGTATTSSDSSAPPTGTKTAESAARTAEADKDTFINMVQDSLKATVVPYDDKNKTVMSNVVTGFPKLVFPGYLGDVGRIVPVPFKVQNFLKNNLTVELVKVSYGGENLMRDPSVKAVILPDTTLPFTVHVVLPADLTAGRHELPVTLEFPGDIRIYPTSGTLSFNYKGDALGSITQNSANYLVFVIIAFIVALIAIVLFVVIKLRVFEKLFTDILRPSGARGDRVGRGPESYEDLLEMRVAFQNPHVGFRNIHRIEEGKAATVGGGLSTFLIFLIPIPAHIAEVTKDGDDYVFTPLKEEFFPEQQDPLPNCLEKDIHIVSKHGYRSVIRFHKYVSPLTQLNNLLHSVQHSE